MVNSKAIKSISKLYTSFNEGVAGTLIPLSITLKLRRNKTEFMIDCTCKFNVFYFSETLA